MFNKQNHQSINLDLLFLEHFFQIENKANSSNVIKSHCCYPCAFCLCQWCESERRLASHYFNACSRRKQGICCQIRLWIGWRYPRDDSAGWVLQILLQIPIKSCSIHILLQTQVGDRIRVELDLQPSPPSSDELWLAHPAHSTDLGGPFASVRTGAEGVVQVRQFVFYNANI